MKNKTLKTVLGVIGGICLFSLISSVFSLIADFVLSDYTIEEELTNLTLLTDVKWASLAVGLLIIPVIVSAVLALLEKGYAFKITSTCLSFVTFSVAFVFMDIIRKDAESFGGSTYASGIAYAPEMMQVAIPCFIIGVLSIVAAVLCSKCGKSQHDAETCSKSKTVAEEAQNEEI
ncbi:MAG: hypothetical protein K2M64_00820 [Clostridia bacterium]|nr:hypothetical protein [Clostridia bacterium]